MIAREFRIPDKIKVDVGATEKYARFIMEPFERGYGQTIGNSLRRVLLASLEGSAVTAFKIDGVPHEFSAIPGIKEDVTEIVLNFKRCNLRLNREESLIFEYRHKGEGEIRAGDIFDGGQIECFNPDLVVCTATTKTADFHLEIKVARGRGYVTADKFEVQHAELGTIYLDANFSPVQKVNFLVEAARVGQTTDYDRLILEVWTNGSITPELAVQEAANLLIDHFRLLVEQRRESADESPFAPAEDSKFSKALNRPVEELELSVRAANCLKAANIKSIGELVVRTEQEMLQFPNFGKKSLDEIKSLLLSLGMNLGMVVPGYTPEALVIPDNIEEDFEEEDEE
jgi:DNA-directed RNA polymerase subunit alpha